MHWCYALLNAALEMGTYAVDPMRSMFHQQLMTYYRRYIQQAPLAAYVLLS